MQAELQTALFHAFDTLNLQQMKSFNVPPVTLHGVGALAACGPQAQSRGLRHLFVMVDSFLHQAGMTAGQLAQVASRMAALIVEVIDGTLSPLAQGLMQTEVLPAGIQPEVITLSGGVGECYRHQPADPFCFSDIGPLLATALHEHPRLREMNVQFPTQTVRATVIGAGAHTLSLSGSTIWLEGVPLPLRNLPVAIPQDAADLPNAWLQALTQLDLAPEEDAYVLALPASLPVRYATLLTVIDDLLAFVARFPNPRPLLLVAEQDFGKALGMLLRPQLPHLPLAVIDEVSIRAGDYIDIGTPLFGGSVVPVTVKSLAFPS
ncbi:ethanolamine ammonia-lyase reactivating factor EutA [Klebsiella pneumoniae]